MLEREPLRNEIVLPTDAADDPAVFETIGNHVAEQGRHHGVVDEACVDARAAFDVLTAVQLVDIVDRPHAEFRQDVAWHLTAQRGVERARPEKKPASSTAPSTSRLRTPAPKLPSRKLSTNGSEQP